MTSRIAASCSGVWIRRVAVLASVGVVSGAPTSAQSGAFADPTSLASRALGLTVAASGGPRDTLGLLVAVVTRDGPADQAGITSGSRILAINGKPVRLEPNEIGQRAAADTAMTRFERAVRASASGTDVMLRITGGGRTRTVSLPMRVSTNAAPTDHTQPSSPFGLRSPAADPSAATLPLAIEASVSPTIRAEVPLTQTPPARGSATPLVGPSVASGAAFDTLASRLADVQLAMRRTARETRSIALSDSLADLDQAIAQVRRRLRALTPEPDAHLLTDSGSAHRPTAAAPPVAVALPAVIATPVVTAASPPAPGAPATATPARLAFGGLELTRVTADLAAYLGAMADSALLVVKASDEWEPLKAGDVVLQVDSAPPEPLRMRAAFETHALMHVLVLRRGRTFTLSFGDSPAK